MKRWLRNAFRPSGLVADCREAQTLGFGQYITAHLLLLLLLLPFFPPLTTRALFSLRASARTYGR